MVCLGPRDPVDITGPRPLSDVGARPLNFTVRGQMVSYGPLLDRTHQSWKLRLSNLGVLLATGIIVVPFFFYDAASRAVGIYSGLGALIAAISLFISFGTIRCPTCGSRWLLRAAKQPAGRWLQWLRAQQVCPSCGTGGTLPSNNRWRGP